MLENLTKLKRLTEQAKDEMDHTARYQPSVREPACLMV